jgi:HD superfamily phosphohydrolase
MLIDEVYNKVDAWVSEILGTRHAPKIRDFKVFRDPIHDFIRIYPHEVAVIDSPVFQRLRRIRQNALAYFVYPGMHHTRFEHSMGVVHVAELVLNALEKHHRAEITLRTRAVVRLAALLHDIGHVFFSHLGEKLLEEKHGELFANLADETVDGTPHLFQDIDIAEILSYLITTSPSFVRYFKEALSRNPGRKGFHLTTIEPTEVARVIIGKVRDEQDQFKADIVHGGMDADKIDYFMRDCHYSGIRAEVDAPRLINTMAILSYSDWPKTLTVSGTALHHLEQILITKLILYTSVYHHHKVRASEAAVRTIFRRLEELGGGLKHRHLEFAEFTDFLRIDDARFFIWAAQEDGLKGLVEQVTGRELLKRSLVLCRQSVHLASRRKFLSFAFPGGTIPRSMRLIEQEIYDSIHESSKVGRDWLVLDFPTLPDADKEAAQTFIQAKRNVQPEVLKDLLPTDDWLRSYAVNKYRAHVFYVSDEKKRRAAADAAESVLKQRGIKLTPLARDFAHLG